MWNTNVGILSQNMILINSIIVFISTFIYIIYNLTNLILKQHIYKYKT